MWETICNMRLSSGQKEIFFKQEFLEILYSQNFDCCSRKSFGEISQFMELSHFSQVSSGLVWFGYDCGL